MSTAIYTASKGLPSWETHIETLARLVLDGKLMLFAGAGLSRLCPRKDRKKQRLPLWSDLIDLCRSRFNVPESIKGLEVFDWTESNQGRAKLEEFVAEVLEDDPYCLSGAHQKLRGIPWSTIYTTNFDLLLSKLYQTSPIVEPSDYENERLNPGGSVPNIIHLHGALGRKNACLTLTKRDYKRWRDNHASSTHRFMNALLDHSMLIVGYGINDPHIEEIIDVVDEWRSKDRLPQRTYYAWMWDIPEPNRVLLANKGIESFSIETEPAWEMAFADLEDRINALSVAKSIGGTSSVYAATSVPNAQHFMAEAFGCFMTCSWAYLLAKSSNKSLKEVFDALVNASEWKDFFDRISLPEPQALQILSITKNMSGDNNPVQSLNVVRVRAGKLPM